MRGKIIAVNAVIVIVVGLLAFALMRAAIGDVVANPDRARLEADRSTVAANAQLQLEALNLERWLSQQAVDPQVREPFTRETPSARSEIATNQANRLFSAITAEFPGVQPSLVAFVDASGIAVGRNGSSLMRGDDLGKPYPGLIDTIKKGRTGSDLWVNKARSDQLFVSYTAVRDASGTPVGGILLGTPLNDGRISAISEATSGRPLLIGIASGAGLEVIAKSKMPDALAPALATLKPVGLGADRPQQVEAPGGYLGSGYGLLGYGDGKRAILVAFAPVALVENVSGLLWPILGATALGIVLVIIAGNLLGSYIQRPILELEEGLLAVINGQTDRRFELEHAELGGLIFRINTLLNTLMGVQEDDTDEEGRPSHAPRREDFNEAEAVDAGGGGEAIDRAAVASLRAEPADAYYARLYGEYIAAKRQIGDPVDHITKEAFVGRMQQSEADTQAKQGKPVRYRVELRGREVMLLAVPLELSFSPFV